MTDSPNYINHIALVLDASVSMTRHQRGLVRVADAEIAHLARRSQELDQETRVTVYVFSDDVKCVVYDKDVLRLPSIRDLYRVGGNTALVAATMLSQDDLAHTAQLYGDHAFLTYVLTDGEENVSRFHRMFGGPGSSGRRAMTPHTTAEVAAQLAGRLGALPDNWTVACLVPDQRGVHEARSFGFPRDNIAVWDTTTQAGVERVFGETIRRATESFMTGRSRGVRGSKTLFTGGADTVNRDTVAAARADGGLTALDRSAYRLIDVPQDEPIRPFVERTTGAFYRTGSAFYRLMKPEKVQPQKAVLVRDRKSGRVYGGGQARALLGLPDHEVRVKPDENPLYEVYVQSTSINRRLVAGTKLVVLV